MSQRSIVPSEFAHDISQRGDMYLQVLIFIFQLSNINGRCTSVESQRLGGGQDSLLEGKSQLWTGFCH